MRKLHLVSRRREEVAAEVNQEEAWANIYELGDVAIEDEVEVRCGTKDFS